MPRSACLLILLGLLIVSTGCQALPLQRAWSMADLVLMDPVDTSSPSTDILAVYQRLLGSDREIRVDLLDIPLAPTYDLSIRLKNFRSEYIIDVSSTGLPVVQPSDPGVRIRVIRDPWLDYVLVRYNDNAIDAPFSIQVTSRSAGQEGIQDETALVNSGDISEKQRVPVMIAFWNVFPAYSPAQVLRRWDGAHTGPFGGRHGLKHILDAVESYEVPVALLDARTPASLAALDYAGFLPQVKRLQQAGSLLMPDSAYSSPSNLAVEFSRKATSGFGLAQSQFVYSPGVEMVGGYAAQFMSLPASSYLAYHGGTRIIPLPGNDLLQATEDGPGLDVRRQLVSVLFSEDDADLVVLGGSLPDSSWGDSDMAYPTFAWIAAHPWIWVLDQADLMTFPATRRYAPPVGTETTSDIWLEQLSAAPDNAITRSAWQMYLMYHAPSVDSRLIALRDVYMGQVGLLLRAAQWADSPTVLYDCSGDPDLDDEPECVLADKHYFAIMELNGGRLTHLFSLDGEGAHQLIAPTVQFALGLSDASRWSPESGDAADPGALMGAFLDPDRPLADYQVLSLSEGELTISRLDNNVTKIFHMSGSGLDVTCQAGSPYQTVVPLLSDPQEFYYGMTEVLAISRPGSWTWGPAGGAKVQVRSDASLSALGFNVSRLSLGLPEDPNHFFQAGHYYPFPFSIVSLTGQDNFTTWIMGK